MIFYIGEDCIMPDGRIGHIQDTNYLSLSAKVGVPDLNNIIWDAKWYFFDDLKKLEDNDASRNNITN